MIEGFKANILCIEFELPEDKEEDKDKVADDDE